MSPDPAGTAPTASPPRRLTRRIGAAAAALVVASGAVFAWSRLSDDGEKAAGADPELCSLVKRSEVEAVLGAEVVEGPDEQKVSGGFPPLEFRGMSVFCRYRTADDIVVWFATARFTTARFARAAFSEFVTDPNKTLVEPIPLLGLDAVWTNPGGQLMALRGDDAVFGMVINGPAGYFAYERERATRLATAALERL